jgi:hypothetical protein
MRRFLATQLITFLLVFGLLPAPAASALGSSQNPQSGSVGLEATVPSPPPSVAATIGVPSNGQVFTSTPITVSGLCQTGLLVKIFSNNVFTGSAVCTAGSYALKVDLFSGQNDLVARVYDSLDQQGPDSNVVSVTFNDAQFAAFGPRVALTSSYARRGANPGSVLSWPFTLSGGTGPYALSVDWGDGSGVQLKSVAFPGIVTTEHTYAQAGVYTIVVKATDANNASAYLQVVGVANGKVSGSVSSSSSTTTTPNTNSPDFPWQFALIVIPLLFASFWLGRRHELYAIRHAIEASREQS